MDHEVNIQNETNALENERMTADSDKTSEESLFKKARYAWQIKGHVSSDPATLNGEASCDGSDNSKSDSFSDFSNLDDSEIQDSDVNGTITYPLTAEIDAGHDRKNIDYVDSNSQKHSDMIEFIGNKRKIDLLNSDDGCGRAKRLRNVENTNSSCRNDLNTCSANAHLQPNRFVNSNIQAEIATSANNPDFRRAVSNIVPSFQGFDIPSFIWQKQEMGCAIVDNVFNRTLEEMGLSPDPVVNLSATTRLTVENQSIESAIRNQGLHANNSHSDQNAILRNMEEMRRTATRTDFEHTQSQLSRMLARQPPPQTLHAHSAVGSDHTEKNCAMNVQIIDSNVNGKDNGRISSSGTSSENDMKYDKSIVNSTSSVDHEKATHMYGDTSKSMNHINNLNEEELNEEIMGPANDKDEIMSIEDSESVHCKDIADKSSDNVLDLAVSTAIMNQGLTYE